MFFLLGILKDTVSTVLLGCPVLIGKSSGEINDLVYICRIELER